jgi:hypothetical protein
MNPIDGWREIRWRRVVVLSLCLVIIGAAFSAGYSARDGAPIRLTIDLCVAILATCANAWLLLDLAELEREDHLKRRDAFLFPPIPADRPPVPPSTGPIPQPPPPLTEPPATPNEPSPP